MQHSKRKDAEYDYKLKRLAIVSHHVASILIVAGKCVTAIGMAYFAYRIAKVFSGKMTTANVLMKAVVDMKADQVIAYILAGGGTLYGLRERRLRKKTTKRLTNRASKLESLIDPTRTSSGLPATGDTPEEDI